MKWLAIGLIVLVCGLAAFPATVGAVGALMGRRVESAQSVNYISREMHAMDAGRHRAGFRRKLDRLTRGLPF